MFHYQTNFGFTKLGSNMHSFRVKVLSNWKIWFGTPCTFTNIDFTQNLSNRKIQIYVKIPLQNCFIFTDNSTKTYELNPRLEGLELRYQELQDLGLRPTLESQNEQYPRIAAQISLKSLDSDSEDSEIDVLSS